MKNDGRLGRNFLKGSEGDAINAILCGAGHNLRKILRLLALLCPRILASFIKEISETFSAPIIFAQGRI
jgi:hypothetical protein